MKMLIFFLKCFKVYNVETSKMYDYCQCMSNENDFLRINHAHKFIILFSHIFVSIQCTFEKWIDERSNAMFVSDVHLCIVHCIMFCVFLPASMHQTSHTYVCMMHWAVVFVRLLFDVPCFSCTFACIDFLSYVAFF